MYANRIISCSNNDGVTLRFTEKGFTPFLLMKADGIYTVTNKVTVSENAMNDGATYQGSVAKYRNIVLSLKDNVKVSETMHTYNRNLLYELFKSGSKGKMTVEDEENIRTIDYYVEKLTSTASPFNRVYTASLICPDPFFYAPHDIDVYLSNWMGDFEFIHEFTASKEEFGHRSQKRIDNIYNESAANNIGMTIKIETTGAVTNPKITRIEDNEFIQLGNSVTPFVLDAGEVLEITTGDNDKHIYLTKNGTKTEINQYLTEDSTFIQLKRGNNNIGYSAESGDEYITVTITYRLKFEGA